MSIDNRNENVHKATLHATRGISGSGKSHIALEMVKNSRGKLVRINRDDLREKYFGRPVLTAQEELAISKIQRVEVLTMLQLGKDVIVDDTNLPVKVLRSWYDLAQSVPANFNVIPVEVPLEVALEQNRKRAAAGGRFVPESVIIDKFERFMPKGKFQKLPDFASMDEGKKLATTKLANIKIYPYVPDLTKPEAWIFDMDGTLALFEGLRGPFEWAKVGGDLPHPHVLRLALLLQDLGYKIIITSARDGICRPETIDWLNRHGVKFENLFMRDIGDGRKDYIVKNELFNAEIRDNYNICGVVDDRLQVCRLWFDLGLPLFRVGDPEAVF
jgi:predicted kinase